MHQVQQTCMCTKASERQAESHTTAGLAFPQTEVFSPQKCRQHLIKLTATGSSLIPGVWEASEMHPVLTDRHYWQNDSQVCDMEIVNQERKKEFLQNPGKHNCCNSHFHFSLFLLCSFFMLHLFCTIKTVSLVVLGGGRVKSKQQK